MHRFNKVDAASGLTAAVVGRPAFPVVRHPSSPPPDHEIAVAAGPFDSAHMHGIDTDDARR
jgi:hypothetical protein